MFKVGDIEIYLIQDSVTHADPGGMFGLIPRFLWSRYIKPNEHQLIPNNTLCLLVKTAGKHILVDVGFGENKLSEKLLKHWGLTRPRGSLLDALGRLGLAAGDIDIVINTHLHADHTWGNTAIAEDGTVLPVFPNAVYFTQRREYQDATHPNERTRATYLAENFVPLVQSGQMKLLDGDTEFVRGVRGVVTPGHTPGHMSVVFESGGQAALFVCDMASMAPHFERLAWMTAYDVEPLVTLETKRKWQQWALEHDALLFLVHDTQMPVARLKLAADGKPQLQAVEYIYS